MNPPPKHRLLWDCSHIAEVPALNTGIERVVREMWAALAQAGPRYGLEVVPCVTDGTSRLQRLGTVPSTTDEPWQGTGPSLEPEPGDTWLLADNAWDTARLLGLSPHWRQGMRVVLLQHDLVPLQDPSATTPLTAELFSRWMREAVAFADAFVCVSAATAEALSGTLPRLAPWRQWQSVPMPVVHPAPTWRSPGPAALPSPGQPLRLVSVGTVEPRKGYGVLLDALEAHWHKGGRSELHIVGRPGWNSGDLHKRIRHASEGQPLLRWLDDADDAQLQAEYAWASAFVSLSRSEGFGLPVVEAAAAGLPLLLSDIPVYRETAGESALFVPARGQAAVREVVALLDELTRGSVQFPASRPAVATRTWADAADELLVALTALPGPDMALRRRWDQRASLAVASLYRAEEPARAGSDLAPAPGPRARPWTRPLARAYSQARLRAPAALVRAVQGRNQLFRLVNRLDGRASAIEARLADLVRVGPTARALQDLRRTEARETLRLELESILAEVEQLVAELDDGPSVAAYEGYVAKLREQLGHH